VQVSVLRVALDVARGMQYLHQHKICHGDLTSNNVLLCSSSDVPLPLGMTAKVGAVDELCLFSGVMDRVPGGYVQCRHRPAPPAPPRRYHIHWHAGRKGLSLMISRKESA